MSSKIETMLSEKNHWLAQQVEVEFPTPESIAGRDIYLKSQQAQDYTVSSSEDFPMEHWVDEVIEVDFHRLTIMFSVIQSSNWSDNPEEQSLIVEFLTQIILDSEYQLYLGFIQGEAVSALISKVESNNEWGLLSDISVANHMKNKGNEKRFAADVLNYLNQKALKPNQIIHPIFA